MYSLDWAYAFAKPRVEGLFRSCPEDFYVNEDLGFELTGSGEHVYLQLQKRGDNTAWLARQIAQLAEVQNQDVGYAGLKDRHAVTRQWFSVYLPKAKDSAQEPDWSQLESESVTLLQTGRHTRKLRRGDHRSNQFVIRLRQLQGDVGMLQDTLQQVQTGKPLPNYYGPQRFGIDCGNLELANRLLVEGEKIRNRQRRGLAMSAARSYLFNQVLSARVADGSWLQSMTGEPLLNDQPTGPLWGRGRSLAADHCLAFEDEALAQWQGWRDGLEHVGLSQERRLLALCPQDFQFHLEDNQLDVSFALPPGTFATSVLREFLILNECTHHSFLERDGSIKEITGKRNGR